MAPNTGVDENGVVTDHPGFNPKGSGGILDSVDFANGDFLQSGYGIMTITVTDVRPLVKRAGTIYVENLAPNLGTCQTPPWVVSTIFQIPFSLQTSW